MRAIDDEADVREIEPLEIRKIVRDIGLRAGRQIGVDARRIEQAGIVVPRAGISRGEIIPVRKVPVHVVERHRDAVGEVRIEAPHQGILPEQRILRPARDEARCPCGGVIISDIEKDVGLLRIVTAGGRHGSAVFIARREGIMHPDGGVAESAVSGGVRVLHAVVGGEDLR